MYRSGRDHRSAIRELDWHCCSFLLRIGVVITGRIHFALRIEGDLRFRDRIGRIVLGPLIDLTAALFTPGVNIWVDLRAMAEIILLFWGERSPLESRSSDIFTWRSDSAGSFSYQSG